VVSGFGAIFAALVLLKLQLYIDLKYVYFMTAGYCVVVAMVCIFGVKNISYNPNAEKNMCKRL
jgi:hypothetical protein